MFFSCAGIHPNLSGLHPLPGRFFCAAGAAAAGAAIAVGEREGGGRGTEETPFHPAGHRPPPPSSNRRCYCYHHRPLLVSFSSFLFDPPLFAPRLLLHRTRREFRDGGYLLVLTDIAVLPLRGGSIQPVVAGFFPWGDPTLC